MDRLIAVLQLLLALLCAAVAVGTAINLGFILTRPDSISVANVLVGQSLLIICLSAAATILTRKARRNLTRDKQSG